VKQSFFYLVQIGLLQYFVGYSVAQGRMSPAEKGGPAEEGAGPARGMLAGQEGPVAVHRGNWRPAGNNTVQFMEILAGE